MVRGVVPQRLEGLRVLRDEALLRHRLRAEAVSYTHLRAHETVLDLVCRLLLEKKKHNTLYYLCSMIMKYRTRN